MDSLVRLAEANARLELRQHVSTRDIDCAIAVMLASKQKWASFLEGPVFLAALKGQHKKDNPAFWGQFHFWGPPKVAIGGNFDGCLQQTDQLLKKNSLSDKACFVFTYENHSFRGPLFGDNPKYIHAK